MLRNKTVLVLGAGASFEAGMPIGSVLKTAISDLMAQRITSDGGMSWSDGQHPFCAEVVHSFSNLSGWGILNSTALRIARGVSFSSSIDNFLEITRDEEVSTLAKAAISKIILDSEKVSKLWFDDRRHVNHLEATKIDGTWYQEFAQLFFEKVAWSDLPKALDALTVVSFNYDRCFEHFLRHATAALYGVPLIESDKVVSRLRVIHPYGQVGELDWKLIPDRSKAVEFGGSWERRLRELAPQLKTFTESTDEGTLISVRDAIAQADTLALFASYVGV